MKGPRLFFSLDSKSVPGKFLKREEGRLLLKRGRIGSERITIEIFLFQASDADAGLWSFKSSFRTKEIVICSEIVVQMFQKRSTRLSLCSASLESSESLLWQI
jgi:hypothetical protein